MRKIIEQTYLNDTLTCGVKGIHEPYNQDQVNIVANKLR